MHRVFKVTSFIACAVMFSACTESDTSMHEPSNHTESDVTVHGATDETNSHDDAKPVHSDGVATNETRSAQSHTHGDASLAIVLDGSTMTVELDTPLYNLLGFEHAAETPSQKASVLKAESVLSKGSSLFVFNSDAGCVPSNQKISVELGVDDHDDDHE